MSKYFKVVGLAVLLAVASGCGNLMKGGGGADPGEDGSPPKEEKKVTEVVFPVEATKPHRAAISAYATTASTILAERRVDIISKGLGQCLELMAEEGDEVRAGDILAELDKAEIEAQIEQSRVSVAQQKHALDLAKKQRGTMGYIAEDENRARFAHDQALASLNILNVQLKNLTIRAPIGGIITQRNIQVGMLVSSGAPVYTVMDPTSLVLPVNLPERELSRLHEGQKARVVIDSLQGEELDAQVLRINPTVDVSGTVKVTLTFDAETCKRLREGLYARVRLVMETHEQALLLPKDAVLEENTRAYVMVILEKALEEEKPETPVEGEAPEEDAKEAKPQEEVGEEADEGAVDEEAVEEVVNVKPRFIAERVEVQTGLEDREYIEIISGIDEDALVVTLGQHTLKSGSAVKVTTATAEILARQKLSPKEALAAAKEKAAEDDKTPKNGPGHGGKH
jgi:membrane fusion protein (multidrug efflux system)